MDGKVNLSEAQQDLKHRRDLPVPGDPYRHYKGGVYTPTAVGILESDGTVMVSYRNLSTRDPWVRPLSEWEEHIKWPDGAMRPRFSREGSWTTG